MIPIPERFPSIRKTKKLTERLTEKLSSVSTRLMTMQSGNIAIISIPPGGKIYIDDVDTGIRASALISDLSLGDHDIKIILSGYNDFIDTVTIEDGSTSSFFVIMTPIVPPIGTGTLNVTSTPLGVEFGIYAGGTDSYVSPVSIPDIPAGINAYEGGLTNYTPILGSFVINSGKITNLHLPSVLSTPDMGLVLIESIPIGAEIFIDDVDIGAYTSFLTMMTPGYHTYELRLSGYTPAKGDFTVVTGYDTPAIVSVQLKSEGTGVILLAGAAILGMMMIFRPK
jgi:hypothetical protein